VLRDYVGIQARFEGNCLDRDIVHLGRQRHQQATQTLDKLTAIGIIDWNHQLDHGWLGWRITE
jgi:hypothetical protein